MFIGKKILKTFLAISVFYHGLSYANLPVVDAGAIAQMFEEYQELVKLYNEMTTASSDLNRLKDDSLRWESFNFSQYRTGLSTLSSDMEKAKKIISDVNKFTNLYPGFDNSSIRNYSNDFKTRSDTLLNLLSTQMSVANDALANQKDINNADTSNSAAVANLTLASLGNLNSQMSAEIRAANAYRATQVQNEVDQKQELQNFIGSPYKKHDDSQLKTWVGDKS